MSENLNIPIDALYFEDNVRTTGCLNIPKMVGSLKNHGFLVNHPLVVSNHDGRYLVLCGNRRGLSACFLRDNEPDAFERVFPDGTIPCIVHTGLTEKEEVLLRIDHSREIDREPLDEFSEFQAIRQLVKVGEDTQDGIAVKLGLYHTKGKNVGAPNRAYVQVRANLARLPGYVQDEFKKYCYDRNSTPFRITMVGGKGGLFTTYQKEYMEHPDGKGPEFATLWAECMTPKADGRSDNPDQPQKKSLTPKTAIERGQVASSTLLKEVLLVATGQMPGTDLSAIDSKMVALETARDTLSILEWFYKDDWAGFVKDAIDAWVDHQDEVTGATEKEEEEVTA